MITKNTSIPTRKRTHLKPHQLTVLQNSFSVNPLPDGTIRSQLARDLGVSERTIQIWFQNRRAKARKMEALSTSLSIGSNCHPLLPRWMERPHAPPRYQPTFRTMMTPKRFEEMRQQNCHQQQQQKRRPCTSASHVADEERDSDLTSTSTLNDSEELSSALPESCTVAPVYDKGLLVPLLAKILRIGTWTRFAQGDDWDLSCDADPLGRQMIWQVQANDHLFRIQVPFDAINQLRLGLTELEIDLLDPSMLIFSMKHIDVDKGWIRCGDFSEGQQASLEHVHVLQGSYDVFQQVLFDLSSLAPELTQKVMYTPPPMDDPCREFTLSPSATPEPFTLYNAQSMMGKWGIVDPYTAAAAATIVAPPLPQTAMLYSYGF